MQALIFGYLSIKGKVRAIRRRQAEAGFECWADINKRVIRSLPRGQGSFFLTKKNPKSQERTMLPRSRQAHGPPFFQAYALWGSGKWVGLWSFEGLQGGKKQGITKRKKVSCVPAVGWRQGLSVGQC